MVVDEHHPVDRSRRSSARPPGVASRRFALGMASRTSVPSPGRGRDLGPAAVALHPADDRLPYAQPVVRDRRRGRTPARGRGRTPTPARRRPRRRPTPGRAADAYLAALTIASRAACSSAPSRSSTGQSPTTTTSTAPPCTSSTSAAAALERRAERSGRRAPSGRYSQLPQRAFLGAGQPGHLARVVRVALDQGERLQHRVVHVRGELGALLRPDPLAPLLATARGRCGPATDRRRARSPRPPPVHRRSRRARPGDHPSRRARRRLR